jgi:hypothetical protein
MVLDLIDIHRVTLIVTRAVRDKLDLRFIGLAISAWFAFIKQSANRGHHLDICHFRFTADVVDLTNRSMF